MTEYVPNFLAVLIAGLIPMLIGSMWYGPVFGKKWLEMVGKTEEEIKENFNPIKAYVFSFVMSLIMAYVLAHMLEAWNAAYAATGLWRGMQGAFWAWLGFALTIGYQHVAWNNQKLGLYFLNMTYNLVCLLAMGALLGVWR